MEDRWQSEMWWFDNSNCGSEPEGPVSYVNSKRGLCQLYSVDRDVSSLPHSEWWIHLNQQILQSGKYNFEGVRCPVRSNLNIEAWRRNLTGYGDAEVCDFLEFGWPISHDRSVPQVQCLDNYNGATDYPREIAAYLQEELGYGSIIGPFEGNPFNGPVSVSPLNTVEKVGTVERRVILDLSAPVGRSVNDGIDKTKYLGEDIVISYPTVDSLVELVREKGRGCLLYKRDLKRAYRQLPIDPGDISYLAYRWEGQLYCDTVLPMGMTSSAFICQRTTSAVSFIMGERGYPLVNYIDDFAGAEHPSHADKAFQELAGVLQELGLRESVKKAVPPSTRMEFLGVQLDTEELTLTVTQEKVRDIKKLTDEWMQWKRVKIRDVQQLVGKLNFVSRCVRPGRVLVSRLLNFLRAMSPNKNYVVPEEVRKDVIWWNRYLDQFNGITMMPMEDWSEPDAVIEVDACLSGSGGINWVSGEVFHEEFPEEVMKHGFDINVLEMLTLTIALKLWGYCLKGKLLMIHCDNMVTVSVINSGRTRSSMLQDCLREVVYWTAKFECHLRAIHIPGDHNRVADSLSRWHLDNSYRHMFWQEVRVRNPALQIRQLKLSPFLFQLTNSW